MMITRRSLFGFAAAAVVAPMLPAVAPAVVDKDRLRRAILDRFTPEVCQRWVNVTLTPGYVIDLGVPLPEASARKDHYIDFAHKAANANGRNHDAA